MLVLLTILFTIFIFVIGILYGAFSWGYVASILAGWYLYPLFPNIPIIEWYKFAGLNFLIKCIIQDFGNYDILQQTRTSSGDLVKIKNSQGVQTATLFLLPWVFLLVAWIFHVLVY